MAALFVGAIEPFLVHHKKPFDETHPDKLADRIKHTTLDDKPLSDAEWVKDFKSARKGTDAELNALIKTPIYECNIMYPDNGKAVPNAAFVSAFGKYLGLSPPSAMTTADDYTSSEHQKFIQSLIQNINWAYLTTPNKCNCLSSFKDSIWPPLADLTKKHEIIKGFEPYVNEQAIFEVPLGTIYTATDNTVYISFRGLETIPETLMALTSAKQAKLEFWLNNQKEPDNYMSDELASEAFTTLYNGTFKFNLINKGGT